ncbi:MAG: porin [Cryomorphaceae bacterium]|nr:porin [Cryomorphaceae bacterium]
MTFAILVVLSCLFDFSVQAQNPVLNKYTFGEGLTFSSNDYSLTFRGYAQPFSETTFYSDTSLARTTYTRFRMRRLRLEISGDAAKEKIDYRLQVDLSGSPEVDLANSTYLLDAWVSYNFTKRVKLAFGQKATPTDNRGLTVSSQSLQLVERSPLTSAFSTIREFGLFFQGDIRTKGGAYFKNYFTLTNGDGLNALNADHGGFKVGGRIDYLPFGLFSNLGQFREVDMMRELSPKLVIGVNASFNKGMSSRRGRESGAILYLNDSLQESLPDFSKIGVDFMFKYRGFSVLGEFVQTAASVPDDITRRVRVDGTTSTVFDVDGAQNVENYVRSRMMLGSGYNIQVGYLFKSLYSIDIRYTHLNADEYSFLNNGTFYNRPDTYAVGVSKYLSRNYGVKVQASFSYVKLNDGSLDIIGNPISGHLLIGHFLTSIAF